MRCSPAKFGTAPSRKPWSFAGGSGDKLVAGSVLTPQAAWCVITSGDAPIPLVYSLQDPEGSTEVLPLDLANLKSVQGFADEFTRRHDRLDVLLNNAGVTFIPHERTVDGFERQSARTTLDTSP